jgi:hypothetical protein
MGCAASAPIRTLMPMPRPALALVLALAFGVVFQALFYREEIGLNAPITVALLLLLGWRLQWTAPRRIDRWMPAMALAFAAFLAIRTEREVVVFDVLAILLLAAAWSASLRGLTVSTLPVARLLAAAWHTATGALWRAAPALPPGARALPLGDLRRSRLLPIVTGVLLALPLLLLFGSLFTSADPVFARWWEDLLDLTGWAERLREGWQRGLIALVVAWLVLGAVSWRATPREETAARPGPIGGDMAMAFLGTLAVLFAVFVAIQVAYLFGGRDTLEAAGITHAEYARRGFFELLTVAILTGLVLFGLDLATGARTRAYDVVALLLLGLTGVILVSSLYRLALYQQEYGWSEQRFYAVAAIASVALGLAILAAAVVTGRMRYAVQPVAFAALAVALVVNAIGPASFVVRANAARGGELDHYYLVGLGPAALPELVAARERVSDKDRFCLDAILYDWYFWSTDSPTPSWQSWNLDRERARSVRAGLTESLFRALGEPGDQLALRDRVRTECTVTRPANRLLPSD